MIVSQSQPNEEVVNGLVEFFDLLARFDYEDAQRIESFRKKLRKASLWLAGSLSQGLAMQGVLESQMNILLRAEN